MQSKGSGRSGKRVQRNTCSGNSASTPGKIIHCEKEKTTHSDKDLMFSHMFQKVSFTDVRRRALTLIDVISESDTAGPLYVHRLAIAVMISWVYWNYILPMMSLFGTGHWSNKVTAGLASVTAVGPGADVHWAVLVLITVAYLSLVVFGVRFMERRPPVQKRIFEWMVVYNATQALLNLRLASALFQEVCRLGYRWPWGHEVDPSENGYALSMLIWFQYHCRQLDLLDTLFMILRKKFQRISTVHVYLRILNLWGWFMACRFACGGDTYFPAIVNAMCQVVVYLYYLIHVVRPKGVPFFRRARVAEIQVLQFTICALHAAFVLIYGNIPRSLAAVNLFVMANCLIFYIDFDDNHPRLGPRRPLKSIDEGFGHERVTICFDSCGWLYCYHFGVAKWIEEHLLPERMTPADAATDRYPAGLAFSGSSGGSLVAGALGSGINIRNLFEYVLELRDYCQLNPWRIFQSLESALDHFLPENCARSLSGRVRVLLTRVSTRPPFVTGEIVDQYKNYKEAWDTLRASCHIPGLLFWPYQFRGRSYFDGLLWSTFFVPWVSDNSLTIRVSALGRPLTDMKAPLQPIWWSMLPPSKDALRGLFWIGYRDAARYFSAPKIDPLEFCKCRRLFDDDGNDSDSESDSPKHRPRAESTPENQQLRKFQAAQKMILRNPAAPVVDPNGKEVDELIKCYTRAVERNFCVLGVFVCIATMALLMTVWHPM